MSRLVKRYKAWRLQRQQLSLEGWADVRAKGRGRFVLREAFTFVILITAFRDVYYQIFEVGHVFSLGFYIVPSVVNGIFLGYMAWDSREDKYRKSQRKSSSMLNGPRTTPTKTLS